MRRIQERVSLLTLLWLAVGIILFAVLLWMARAKVPAPGGIAAFGAVLFAVVGAMFASEVHLAIKAVNLRVDDRVRHGTEQDARLAALERRATPPVEGPR
jgi:membrane protein implicated in regulation of membrane protease activity